MDPETRHIVIGTRRCFDDAAEIMAIILQYHPELKDELRVVHALIHGNEPGHEGEIIAHGWVEHKDDVIFRGIVNGETLELSTPRRPYYRNTVPIFLIRYTAEQVRDNLFEHDSTGPWLDILDAHTRQGKRGEKRPSQNLSRKVLTVC